MLSEKEIKAIEEAKVLLESYGYFVKNLWHVEDVTTKFPDCPEDVAQDILNDALTNEAIFDQIWFDIEYEASSRGYEIAE